MSGRDIGLWTVLVRIQGLACTWHLLFVRSSIVAQQDRRCGLRIARLPEIHLPSEAPEWVPADTPARGPGGSGERVPFIQMYFLCGLSNYYLTPC